MAPKAWSNKDERMYEHVKESEKDKGRSTDRAKEIAARTVNKHRSEEGRTKEQQSGSSSSSSSSSSGGGGLESRTKDELYDRAQELDIEGRSDMSKDELVKAIRDKQ